MRDEQWLTTTALTTKTHLHTHWFLVTSKRLREGNRLVQNEACILVTVLEHELKCNNRI